MHQEAGSDGALLIGVDLKKDRQMIENAYNDSEGVTAEFNLNVLRRLNREYGTDFDLAAFRHMAVYNQPSGRIEMSLVSQCEQVVTFGEHRFSFTKGEKIVTEYSHKFSLGEFRKLASISGFRQVATWVDDNEWFSIQLYER
jgi:uncharacterized SAM-dependent methyltransferase